MKEIFDDYLRISLGEEEQATRKFKQFERNYRRFFPQDRQARLLDIGVGRGEMLSCMRDWGYRHYLGIDISPTTIGFCQRLGLNCQQVEDSTRFLLQHPQTYALISLIDVLEHIRKEHVIAFLAAVKGALAPGGVVIIQVPNLQAPDGQLHRYNDITHEVGYIEHSLAQVLMASGFERFRFQGFEEFVFGTPVEWLRRLFRACHWLVVRFLRGVDGNINPAILHPVFCAIARKDETL